MRAVRTLGGQMILTDRPTRPGDMLDTLLRGLPSAKAAKVRLAAILRTDRLRAPAWVWRPTTRAMSGFHLECRDAGYDRRGRRIIERLAWPKPRYRLERRR